MGHVSPTGFVPFGGDRPYSPYARTCYDRAVCQIRSSYRQPLRQREGQTPTVQNRVICVL